MNTKQDVLEWDATPTIGSNNPVTSQGIFSAIVGGKLLEFGEQGHLVATGEVGTTADLSIIDTSVSHIRRCSVNDISPGQTVVLRTHGSSSYRGCMIVDGSNKVLYVAPQGRVDTTLIAPAGSSKIVLNLVRNEVPSTFDPKDWVCYIQDASANKDTNSYVGCNLSLLGDSLSAYQGWIPSGNHKYYPNPNSDIDSVEQMWWMQVCAQMEMTPLVIEAWSGSGVAAGVRTPSESNLYTPASDVSRCQNLHKVVSDVEVDPDVVLLAIGVNDYSYMTDSSKFGTWDGHTALGSATDDTLSDYDNTTFRSAYATMIARIKKRYPNAMVVAMTLFFTQRRESNTGVTYLNAIGKTIEDYNIAIREVCGQMLVPVIEVTDIGFHRWNFYPTYAEDSEYSATHMTIAGHAELGAAVVKQLSQLHRFGSAYFQDSE